MTTEYTSYVVHHADVMIGESPWIDDQSLFEACKTITLTFSEYLDMGKAKFTQPDAGSTRSREQSRRGIRLHPYTVRQRELHFSNSTTHSSS